jgi:hypothetical protein
MANPKVKGLTPKYHEALADPNHALHSLVQLLSTMDPKFTSEGFEYEAQDVSYFLSLVNVDAAMGIAANEGVTSFTNYPFFVKCDDKTAGVPSFFPASTVYDENGENPTQKSFEQWCLDMQHDVYDIVGGGAFAGDFKRFGLEFAALVKAEVGYDVWDRSTAVANMPQTEE